MAVMAREEWTEARLEEMRQEMAAQNRMLLQIAGGMFATMVIGFLGTIATILTQT